MKKTSTKLLSVLLILSVLLMFSSCKKVPERQEVQPSEVVENQELNYIADFQGIRLLEKFTQTTENGDVAAVILLNTTDKTLQYITFTENFSDGTVYSYTASTIPPGEICIVTEDSESSFKDNSPSTFSDKGVVFFQQEPSVYNDTLQYVGANSILTVKNKSDKDIAENIVIYYKDYAESRFTSGVTYRVTIEGGLKSGEIKQIPAKHFVNGKSMIMFAQFVDMTEVQ